MKAISRTLPFFLALLLLVPAWADAPREGRNKVAIRGQLQDVYFYPGDGTGPHRKILFAPGDGGWRGFAITIAERLQHNGYDVYGLDTRRYLQSFTGGAALSPSDIASDYRQMANWIQQGASGPVLLVGWSEGAGLGLAAAADPRSKDGFAGLVAIGRTERNILAWRWADMMAEITKKLPNEPTFASADYIGKVVPLPLFIIASSHDEYVPLDATRALFAAAREPKRLAVVEASDHKYGGNTEVFFRTLSEALSWIDQQHK